MGKILVTGATGLTGGVLCRRLVSDNKEVVAFVRSTSKIDDLKAIGVECRKVDIRNKTDVYRNFDGIDHVYHIAAAYRTEHARRDEFWRVNVDATRNLLEAAMKKGVERFVHCSTAGVQGEITDPPADESYRVKPGDHYQRTKLEGEFLANDYFANDLPGVVVRPVGIYGPGDTRFLKLFKLINQGRFVMIGNGKTLYHMTYIDDLVEGFILAGQKKEALGEVFTIAGEKYTTIRELVNLIADILDKSHPKLQIPFYPVYVGSVICDKVYRALGMNPPIYPRRVEFFRYDRAFSIEKAKQMIGYQPKVGLREGLERAAAWYKQKKLI